MVLESGSGSGGAVLAGMLVAAALIAVFPFWRYSVARKRRIEDHDNASVPTWTGKLGAETAMALWGSPQYQPRVHELGDDSVVELLPQGLSLALGKHPDEEEPVPPVVIPWDKVLGARQALFGAVGGGGSGYSAYSTSAATSLAGGVEAPSVEGWYTDPLSPIVIAVSESWLRDFNAAKYPAADRDDAFLRNERTMLVEAEPFDVKKVHHYDEFMAHGIGELYQPGVAFLYFRSNYTVGLVKAIRFRATGQPDEDAQWKYLRPLRITRAQAESTHAQASDDLDR
jgi:hypothetical protein